MTAPSPKHSGGHVDTGNRRMISHIGCEDGCGYVRQFLSETFAMQVQSTATLWSSYKTVINVLVGGGAWDDDTDSGPFFRNGGHSRTFTSDKLGARGKSRPRHFF